MDDVDRAANFNQRIQDDAMANHRRNQASTPATSATHCVDCEEPIPQARRAAVKGCRRCIECQEDCELGQGSK